MTSRLPWATAAAILVIAAVGAWMILGPAPVEEAEEEWNRVGYGLPGTATAMQTGFKSGIIAIHIINAANVHNYLTDNLMDYTLDNDNRMFSMTATGQEGNITYGTDFDIVLDVVGHTDNMGDDAIAYLKGCLGFYSDDGSVAWVAADNSDDGDETAYEAGGADDIYVNIQLATWTDLSLIGDENLFIENVALHCRGK